jgi:hypothetical protein
MSRPGIEPGLPEASTLAKSYSNSVLIASFKNYSSHAIVSLTSSEKLRVFSPPIRTLCRPFMERLDQGHSHPKLEVPRLTCLGRESNLGLEARTLAKSYSNIVLIASFKNYSSHGIVYL